MNQQYFPSLKIVIVNWRRAKDTIDCIHSVILNGVKTNQILIVDNGSDDDSVEQISRAIPDVELLQLKENLGFAGGYNFGIESALQSGAKKILLLNNDTILDPQAIQLLFSCQWDIGVPKIYFHNSPDIIWSAGAQWRRFPPMVIMRGYQRKDSPQYSHSIALNSATACALLVRSEVFERVGVFDSDYQNYFEDYDFIFRARQAGYRVGLVSDAKVWHKISQTLGDYSPEKYWFLGRNSVLFYRKGNRFPNWVLYSFLFWVSGRELLKLNFQGTWSFWKGFRDGMDWIKHGISSV